MIKLFVENVYTYYEGMESITVSEIEKVMKYIDPNWVHKQRYHIQKMKDTSRSYYDMRRLENYLASGGHVSLLDKKNKRFPSGLLQQVIMKLKILKKPYEVVDEKKKPTHKINMDSEGFELYDNQKIAFNKMKQKDFRCILDAATAFGKTVVGVAVIDHLKVPTLIIVPTVVIRDQWQEHFEQKFSGISIEKKGSGRMIYDKDGNEAVLVSTAQLLMSVFDNIAKTDSIRKRNIELQKFIYRKVGLLIYDEVHLAGSDTGISILNAVQCYYRLGLTGTFNTREDNKDLEYISLIGERATYVTPSDLIEIERAVKLSVKFYSVDPIMFGRRAEYNSVLRIGVVNNYLRNEQILDLAYEMIEENRQILILVDRINHAEVLSDMGDFEHTSSKDAKRKEKFDMFRNGKIPVLICTTKLAGIGFDMPPLSALILAGGGKSTNKFVQALGRVLRVTEGKTDAKVIDFADNCKYLRDHAIERLKIYRNERQYKVDVKGTYLTRYMRQ